MGKFILMLVMACKIAVHGMPEPIEQVTEVKIESGNDMLTDTCVIKLPASLQGKACDLEKYVVKGKKIVVQIGYTEFDPVTFSGYISATSPENPFVIECEDACWQMKQVTVNKSWKPKEATLKVIVDFLISEVNKKFPATEKITLDAELPDVEFDNFRLVNVNAAQALQQLKDDYGLTAYFVPNSRKLYVGLAYTADRGKVKYDFYRNIVSHSLKYRTEDEVKLQVEAIGVTKDNKKVTVTVPEKGDGLDKRTLYFYNVTSEKELKRLAEDEKKKLVYSGFEGSLTAFLIPYVQHGMSAELVDSEYPERKGTYHVDKVVSTFSASGGRNEVTIGIKL